MPFSVRELHKIYQVQPDKPSVISLSCFRRIWKQHYKTKYRKPKQRDGLCHLCEINHKLKKNPESVPQWQQAIVHRHLYTNELTKQVYKKMIDDLTPGGNDAVLVMDFKENMSIGVGPREIGQSWFSKEKRSVLGFVLFQKDHEGILTKRFFCFISECLAHDAIYVKSALNSLFALDIWEKLCIQQLSIWCDNAPHFKNRLLLRHFLDLCTVQKTYFKINMCFFEAYHGKSEVDGRFGQITTWYNNWIKTNFINSTDDLLSCFRQNNIFSPHAFTTTFTHLLL